MPRIDESTKRQRKDRVQLIVAGADGLRESEIAERVGLEPRTTNNYLRELEHEGHLFKDGLLWYALNVRGTKLRSFELSPEEAYTLYLAARLLVKQQDKRNEPAETALLKLARVLSSDLGVGNEIAQAAAELAQRPVKTGYESIFRTMVQGYLYRRRIDLTYRPYGGKPFSTVFSPYLLEPSAIGYTTYAIGHSSASDALRSYRLDRIETARITRDFYQVPADFPGLEVLRNAWSIMIGEITTRVVLRFSPAVKERVLETRWHPSQESMDDPDKPRHLRWWVDVADTTDMKPWIRSWGGDVEVLEPDELRISMRQVAAKLSNHYKSETVVSRFPYHLPYAKTNPKNKESIHLLLYHLIDVGQVAQTMWADVLTDGIRNRLAGMLDLRVIDCGRFMAFLAALHDLGKAGPAYQKKYAPDWLKHDLEQAGLGLNGIGKAYDKTFPHGTVTTWALKSLLPEMTGLDQRFAAKIAVALGGHHGSWPTPGADDHISDSKHPQWDHVRRDLVWELQAVFSPPSIISVPSSVRDQNTFFTILSGLTSVADWIGSRNDECFGFVQDPMSTRQYAERSTHLAREGLQDLGWMGWTPAALEKTFAEAFEYLGVTAARPVQQRVIDEAIGAASPTLLILEAPTGIGKTETALHVAERWLQANAGRGLYVAMPTQATSNQMYTRVGEFLHRQYPDMAINYHLVHGQAAWADDLKKQVELQGVGDDSQSHVNAESWFNPRKRTLLAPFGVGTVDQALLSILQTRHFFVRLFGLSHKVVIFDEVHAYDTYMNTLFHRLLTWLNAIGTSVIVLSATLPAQTRRELVQAYTGQELPDNPVAYPTVTIANSERREIIPLPKPESHKLELTWHPDRDPAALATYLRIEIRNGGCAAIICNTVGRAQAVYRALDIARQQGELDIDEDNLILFHSRFPPIWRKGIEERVRNKFEKGGQRPQRAIVVATQVIEQSLDIDFDMMITDVAPVDLMVQRAGRLHRHRANDTQRYGLPRRLIILKPEDGDQELPKFGSDTYVYAEYILLRTYLTLHGLSEIMIPDDTTRLIETVYDFGIAIDSSAVPVIENLQPLLRKLESQERKAQAKAGQDLIRRPNERSLLAQSIAGLEEDNPEVHEVLRAQTRDIDFSVTVVCLHQDATGVFVYNESDQKVRIDLDLPPQRELTKLLLQNAIAIQNQWIGKHFVEQPVPPSWSKSAALRYCRYAIFVNELCDLPTYRLKLSQDFGLETIKKEKI